MQDLPQFLIGGGGAIVIFLCCYAYWRDNGKQGVSAPPKTESRFERALSECMGKMVIGVFWLILATGCLIPVFFTLRFVGWALGIH